jgi:hypothetical protein
MLPGMIGLLFVSGVVVSLHSGLKRAVIVIKVYVTLLLPEKQTFKISPGRRQGAMIWGLRAAFERNYAL